MTPPDIIGCGCFPDDITVRAHTILESSMTVSTSGIGGVTATLFRSREGFDRGGIVLRLEAPDNNDEGYFIPYVVQTRTAVDIHMAGDAEAKDLIKALLAVLHVGDK